MSKRRLSIIKICILRYRFLKNVSHRSPQDAHAKIYFASKT